MWINTSDASVGQLEHGAGFGRRGDFTTNAFDQLAGSSNEFVVTMSGIAVRKIDIVFKAHPDRVATHRNAECGHGELRLACSKHTPFCIGEQTLLLINRVDQRAGRRRRVSDTAAVEQPEIAGIAVDDAFVRQPRQPVDNIDFSQFKFDRGARFVDMRQSGTQKIG